MQISHHKQIVIVVFVGVLETKTVNKRRVNHFLFYMIYKKISFVKLILVHIKMTPSVENWQRFFSRAW